MTDQDRQDAIGQVQAALSVIARWQQSLDTRRRIAAHAGLTLPLGDYVVLQRLGDQGPLRLTQVAEQLGVDKSTVTPQARRLEDAGLIRRSPDPTDNRAQLVEVTADGRDALSRLTAARAARVAEVLADWSPAQLSRLAKVLDEFAASTPPRGN